MNCIFCKIISGEIKSDIIYQDDNMIIIEDINPEAKKHYLLIPKNHYGLLDDADKDDFLKLSDSLGKIPSLKKKLGLEKGYRLVINQGKDAGQEVDHLHVHILGGQKLNWNPS